MSQILEQAKLFFDACETGKGWEGCQGFCHPDANGHERIATLLEPVVHEAIKQYQIREVD